MKKIISIMLIVMLGAMLAACGGGSEADKAYISWTENTLPKMDKADTEYTEKAAQVQAGDMETAVTITEEFLAVLKPGVEELAAIDMSKLTSGKDGATKQLEALQTKLEQVEQALASYQSQLGAPTGGDEGVVDEGTGEDEGVVDDGTGGDEGVVDEGDGEVTE